MKLTIDRPLEIHLQRKQQITYSMQVSNNPNVTGLRSQDVLIEIGSLYVLKTG